MKSKQIGMVCRVNIIDKCLKSNRFGVDYEADKKPDKTQIEF